MRAPLTTDDDDERRTIQDGRQSRSYMGARNMPSLRWADTGPVAWRPPRCRGVVVWRCTPPGGRTVLSEVCGRFKSAFARFRHAAPRNQHPRSRVSSRRLREIDPRLGGSSAAAPDVWHTTSFEVQTWYDPFRIHIAPSPSPTSPAPSASIFESGVVDLPGLPWSHARTRSLLLHHCPRR